MFRIEFSEYRYILVSPSGASADEAVSYCSVSTVEHDGEVYGAYLAGDEPELEALSSSEKDKMITSEIRVYPLSNWPDLGEGLPVELEEVVFDEDEKEAAAVVDMSPYEPAD